MAEAIVVSAAAGTRDEEADALAGDRADALRAEIVREPVPPRRRVADAERLERVVDRRGRPRHEPAPRELVERVLAERVLAELLLVEVRGDLVGVVEVVLLFAEPILQPRLGAAILFDRDPRALGERAHGLREGRPLELHHEVDHAPRLFAAEAVEKPAIGVHVEARRLLLVKGAEPHERSPAALQRRDALLDDRDDVGPVAYGGDGLGEITRSRIGAELAMAKPP